MPSYVRVGILGAATGGEVWSINPVIDPTAEFGSTVSQSALDAAATAIAALNPGTNLLAWLSTALTITGARLEVRDSANDNLMAISIATRGTPLAGTGTPKMPPQAATVISLRTDSPGASGRGRVYWPACGAVLGTNLRLGTGDTATILSDAQTYFHAMESALATAFPLIGFDLAVRSKATLSTPHVVRLQVGNVIDTQRRRRDAFPEAYSTGAF